MDLPTRLINISKLEENYTINIQDGTLVYHGLISGFRRKLKSEDRNKTIDYIEGTVDDAIRLLPSEIKYLYFLRDTKKGLQNLKKTYNKDGNIVMRLESIITRVDNTCTRFERSIVKTIEQIPTMIKAMQTSVDVESLCLVRQTPIQSPDIIDSCASPKTPGPGTPWKTPMKTPNETPMKTPMETPMETPMKTPNKTPTMLSPRGLPPVTPPSSPGRKNRQEEETIYKEKNSNFFPGFMTLMPFQNFVQPFIPRKEEAIIKHSYPLPRNMMDSYLLASIYPDNRQLFIEDVD